MREVTTVWGSVKGVGSSGSFFFPFRLLVCCSMDAMLAAVASMVGITLMHQKIDRLLRRVFVEFSMKTIL